MRLVGVALLMMVTLIGLAVATAVVDAPPCALGRIDAIVRLLNCR